MAQTLKGCQLSSSKEVSFVILDTQSPTVSNVAQTFPHQSPGQLARCKDLGIFLKQQPWYIPGLKTTESISLSVKGFQIVAAGRSVAQTTGRLGNVTPHPGGVPEITT